MQEVKLKIAATPDGRLIITPPPGVKLIVEEAGEEWITGAEAAAIVGISPRAMVNKYNTADFPNVRQVGKNALVPRADAEAYRDKPRRRGRPAKQ